MGGGSWDTSAYDDTASMRAKKGVDTFAHSNAVASGAASNVHKTLDPKTVAGPKSPLAGMCVREARDNDEHPNSLPIVVFFDVTGSMGEIPKVLQKKLPKLMEVVIDKGGIDDPQILIGAVGDSVSDKYPLQVSQFESDNKIDEHLTNLILEGGGGGQDMESYALAYRFGAYHTATDSWEKRGKKGYFITIGDEAFWPVVTKEDVKKLFGVEVEHDESIQDLLAKTQEKWEVFHFFCDDSPTYGGKFGDKTKSKWRALLGERVVIVNDSNMICEIIAALILSQETAKALTDVVSDLNLNDVDALVVTNALVPITNTKLPAHIAAGGLPSAKKTGGVTRI